MTRERRIRKFVLFNFIKSYISIWMYLLGLFSATQCAVPQMFYLDSRGIGN